MDKERRKVKEVEVKQRADDILATLDERQRRLWAGAEARQIGRGGISLVAKMTAMDKRTVSKGVRELPNGEKPGEGRQRKPGGGRKKLTENQPDLEKALLEIVEPTSRGNPEGPTRWTIRSSRRLASELRKKNFKIGARSAASLLKKHNFSLRSNLKTVEGKQSPDRNEQFEHIANRTKSRISRGLPCISIDTKKKEKLGNLANKGQPWWGKDHPVKVKTHDFLDKKLGKAIPYGVYDIGESDGFVNVGIDHDTAAFAVNSIRWWWKHIGIKRYPKARSLYVTADGGGSNGSRCKLWKKELRKLSDELGLTIMGSHDPPGTSKWNKIEHFLFNHISMNWRGRPLMDMQTVLCLLNATTTSSGLKVRSRCDNNKYPTKIKVTKKELESLGIKGERFRPDWNYCIKPRKQKN